ncbi:hypothetical protein [Actinoplanes subglobosus]|uniref:Uncharacterized protein n=1 Tax=Actinoplanes subglobosus TaxID=1547892 RepID=A0ABV8J3V3_9ACTN
MTMTLLETAIQLLTGVNLLITSVVAVCALVRRRKRDNPDDSAE